MVLTGGVPKFILQVDFTGDDLQKIQQKLVSIREKVKPYASIDADGPGGS